MGPTKPVEIIQALTNAFVQVQGNTYKMEVALVRKTKFTTCVQSVHVCACYTEATIDRS